MSDSTSLLDRIRHLVERENFTLPVLSEAGFQLQAIATKPMCDLREVEAIIVRDQALATEVLRAANSAFFGGLSQVTTIGKAVMRVGLQQVTNLTLMMSERSKYRARDPLLAPVVEGMWRQASASAIATDWLAARLSQRSREEAFLAGLLHDIGELVLLRALDAFKTTEDPDFVLSIELVKEVLASAHTEVGFNFLQQRRIPEVYCVIARDHHTEARDSGVSLMAMVRFSDLAVRKLGLGLYPDPSLVLASSPEAAYIGADEITIAELEVMLEDCTLALT